LTLKIFFRKIKLQEKKPAPRLKPAALKERFRFLKGDCILPLIAAAGIESGAKL
jgi:hypothetical protein